MELRPRIKISLNENAGPAIQQWLIEVGRHELAESLNKPGSIQYEDSMDAWSDDFDMLQYIWVHDCDGVIQQFYPTTQQVTIKIVYE